MVEYSIAIRSFRWGFWRACARRNFYTARAIIKSAVIGEFSSHFIFLFCLQFAILFKSVKLSICRHKMKNWRKKIVYINQVLSSLLILTSLTLIRNKSKSMFMRETNFGGRKSFIFNNLPAFYKLWFRNKSKSVY